MLSLFGFASRSELEKSARNAEALAPDPYDDFWYEPTTNFPILRPNASGIRVNEQIALTYSACWAALRLLTGCGGMLPFNLHKKKPGGGSEVAEWHNVHRLIHDAPNPDMSSMMFRSSRMNHQINRGNCYAEIGRNKGGMPIALYPIHASRIPPRTNIVRRNGRLVYLVNNDDGTKTPIDQDNMFHVPSMISEDGIVGLGVVENARLTIGFGLAAEQHGAAYFGNSARPNIVIEGAKFRKPEDAELFRKEWVEAHGGPAKNARPALLPPDTKIHTLQFNAQDSQFLESRQHTVEEICRWYGVPPHMVQHLLRSTFCLPGDALVFTESGPKEIKDVAVGEQVWSRSSDGRWVISSVSSSSCTGIDNIIKIRAGLRTLRCNARHVVPVRRKTLVPFTSGRGQCVVIDGKKFRTAHTIQWLEASEIRVGDYLIAAHGLPPKGARSCPTREHCSVAFMESLGMLVGDGFFARTGKRRYKAAFGLSHGERDSYLPHYIGAIESEFTAGDGPYALRNGGTVALKAKARDKNTTLFYSSVAYRELEKLGIAGTAKTKTLPSWIFSLDDELKLAFLRGYLDSDGTVNKSGQIRYVSVNRRLLEQVRHLCISAGIRVANVYSSVIDSDFGNGRKYRHTLHSFMVTNPDDCLRIGTHTDFYSERIRNAISKKRKRRCRVYPHEKLRREAENGTVYTMVESITQEAVVVPVYDLTIDGTHTFVADGILVHNSNIEHQGIDFVKYSLMPWLKLWECEVWRKLLTEEEQKLYYAKFVVDALERGDKQSRTEASVKELFNGLLSINEYEEREDRNPIGPLGDIRWMQQPMVPIEIAAKGPQPSQPTPPNANPPDDEEEEAPPDESEDNSPLASLVNEFESLKNRWLSESETQGLAIDKIAERVKDLSRFESWIKSLEGKADNSQETQKRLAAALVRDAMARMLSIEIHNVKHIAEKPNRFDVRLREFYDKHKTTMTRSLSEPIAVKLAACGGDNRDAAAIVSVITESHISESLRQLDALTDCLPDELPAKVGQCVDTWHETRMTAVVI